jgi:tetratricopeptide (TPR) repeat protein
LSSLGRDNHQLLEEAVESCEKALHIQPRNAAMQFNKAGILESLGRYEEAVQSYDLAYENSSNEPMRLGLILMKKGEALEVLGKNMEAQQTYEKVAVTDRYFGEATEKKAEFMERQGNRESAVTSYRTAGLAFMKQNLFEKAYDSFNRLLAIQPGDEESLYHKGTAALALFEQKQSKELLEEALTAFNDALRIQPENITYLIQKGRCLLDLGRFEEGLQALDRALWINPSDGITLMNKGIALYQLSRHEEALKYFELVCSHHPEHAAPWMMKSRIHMDWKQYDLALTEIDKAIEKSPQDPKAWEIRATILRAQGKDAEAQEAEAHMNPDFL